MTSSTCAYDIRNKKCKAESLTDEYEAGESVKEDARLTHTGNAMMTKAASTARPRGFTKGWIRSPAM